LIMFPIQLDGFAVGESKSKNLLNWVLTSGQNGAIVRNKIYRYISKKQLKGESIERQ
jgi:hypothetical protein